METLDRLLGSLRECCASLPDKRRGANGRYAMADIGLAAFSVFLTQSPSFLSHQRQLAQGEGRSNCATLFGMTKIPCDNRIRDMLDPVPPAQLQPLFAAVVDELERAGGIASFRRLGGRVLIALDGTEYFRSTKLHCEHCSSRARAGGKTEYFHGLLAATLVAPGHSRVVPLAPEFIVPQDGHEKQDCESRTARRWLAAHGKRYAPLAPVYLGDDLYSRQPLCAAVKAAGGHFLFVCKPDSHPTLQEYLTGIELPEHCERIKRGRQRFVHRYRWLADLPLRVGANAMTVNWLMIEIVDAAGKLTDRNSFVTDLVPGVKPGDRSDQRRRTRRRRLRPLEDRERELQHPQGQGLQPQARLRPRQETPRRRARQPEPARLRHPHRLRAGRGAVAARPPGTEPPDALLRKPEIHHQIPRLPLLGRPPGDLGLRSPAARAFLICSRHLTPQHAKTTAMND